MKRELNFVIVLTGSVFTSYTWLDGAVHRVPACIFATNSCSSTLTGQTKRSVPRRIETSESSQHWWRNNRSNVPQSAKYFFGGGPGPTGLPSTDARAQWNKLSRGETMPTADRGGSTSVRGQISSPHSSGGLRGSCADYSLWRSWPRQSDRRTDGRIAVSLNAIIVKKT